MSANGRIIEFNHGQARFMQSLIMSKGVLPADDYVLMVDAAWNEEVSNETQVHRNAPKAAEVHPNDTQVYSQCQ